MKYKVLKNVLIDGVPHEAGVELDLDHNKVPRLVLLGFIEEVSETANRSVGLDTETKPRTRAKTKKKAD